MAEETKNEGWLKTFVAGALAALAAVLAFLLGGRCADKGGGDAAGRGLQDAERSLDEAEGGNARAGEISSRERGIAARERELASGEREAIDRAKSDDEAVKGIIARNQRVIEKVTGK